MRPWWSRSKKRNQEVMGQTQGHRAQNAGRVGWCPVRLQSGRGHSLGIWSGAGAQTRSVENPVAGPGPSQLDGYDLRLDDGKAILEVQTE